ncbi:MAG: 50S ribosomal protein L19e [Candidatus Aenigmarchaeota archaeon]|nr:50S ribosomal protein L19e [Candidatus Aenigmarchaeota archaeon]
MKQKTMAAKVMKCGRSRVWIDPARLADVYEAITLADVRKLVRDGVVAKLPENGTSSFRTKKLLAQKAKGRRKGRGSRKGCITNKKSEWTKRIRAIRKLIIHLKEEGRIDNSAYRDVYRKSKSGFFRSKSHVMIYLERNNLLRKGEKA